MPTYTPLDSLVLTSSTASITFSNISQDYQHLIVVTNPKFSSGTDLDARINGDTGANYSVTRFWGTGSTASTSRNTNATFMRLDNFGYPDTTFAGNNITHFFNYSNTDTYKTILSRANNVNNGVNLAVNLWSSTAAITSITLFPAASTGFTFSTGSTFDLYGIASGSPKASGGQVTRDGTYWYHTFKTTSTFIPNQALTVDYLVVAGGGAGGAGQTGNSIGAGGGAGGLRSTVTATGGGGSLESPLSLSSGITYPVIIGAGGTAYRYENTNGTNGSNSSFSTITSIGGGGGGAGAGRTGGSGGGGRMGTSNLGAAGTANQGFAGGNGGSVSGGGGGGAGAVGNAGSGNSGGSGGIGVQITALATATGTGANSGYYAGGGSGGSDATGATGGSSGGGGSGASTQTGATAGSGTTNTGGGGGGGAASNASGGAPQWGAAGGSGIVILRYTI